MKNNRRAFLRGLGTPELTLEGQGLREEHSGWWNSHHARAPAQGRAQEEEAASVTGRPGEKGEQ